jgi:thiamine pyrophosphate-dependent acetolactate synthase large subunit-like protein
MKATKDKIKGAEAIFLALMAEGVDTIFGVSGRSKPANL